MRVVVDEPFTDFDGVAVKTGTEGDLVMMGFSEVRKKHFWNIIADNQVLAVTLGKPPVSAIKDTKGEE